MTDRQYVLPTGPGMGRGLVNHDDKSKGYRAVALTDETKPRNKTWRRPGAWNQGDTSQCVAYTGKGVLNSQALSKLVPYRKRIKLDPAVLYGGAQTADEWPGEAYDGTSGLGLCRYLKAVGLIQEYRWCFGVSEVLLTLSHVGPVGIGVNWTEDMTEPDLDGYIHPTGDAVGGHEVELTAINVDEERVTLTNSWGDWGLDGKAHLSWGSLGKLLDDHGDAFVITA